MSFGHKLLYANSVKRILVTGANGFVGNHLVKELVDHNLHVIGVGGPIKSNDRPPCTDDYIVLDLMDKRAIQANIDFREIDGVIHLAGLAAVGPSFDNPLDYMTTNIGLEVNLFEAALLQKATPRFLVISSGGLYDSAAKLPLTETSKVIPSSPYAISKLGQEQLAIYYSMRGFECIIARPFNHIGPGQTTGFITPDLTKQVVEFKQGRLKQVLVGNLDAKRDYTDVRDVVRAYRLLLEKGHPGEIYNVCSGEAHSGHEILNGILKAAGVKPPIKKDLAKMRPSDNPIVYGSYQKINKKTGWQPEIPFETTIADVVDDWHGRFNQ